MTDFEEYTYRDMTQVILTGFTLPRGAMFMFGRGLVPIVGQQMEQMLMRRTEVERPQMIARALLQGRSFSIRYMHSYSLPGMPPTQASEVRASVREREGVGNDAVYLEDSVAHGVNGRANVHHLFQKLNDPQQMDSILRNARLGEIAMRTLMIVDGMAIQPEFILRRANGAPYRLGWRNVFMALNKDHQAQSSIAALSGIDHRLPELLDIDEAGERYSIVTNVGIDLADIARERDYALASSVQCMRVDDIKPRELPRMVADASGDLEQTMVAVTKHA